MEHDLVATLEKETGQVFAQATTLAQLEQYVAAYMNHLILNDFEKLIFILYRIDVNEHAIKILLQQANEQHNAGETIAKAIIKRQLEKIETRKLFTQKNDIAPEDQW